MAAPINGDSVSGIAFPIYFKKDLSLP